MIHASMSRMISFWVLLGVIVLLCIVFYRVMAGFLVPLFLAVLLVVIFHPLYDRLQARLGGRRRIAGLITTLAVMLIVLLPLGAMGVFAAIEGRELIRRINPSSLRVKAEQLRRNLGLDLPHSMPVRQIEDSFHLLADRSTIENLTFHDEELYGIQQRSSDLAEQLGLPWPADAPMTLRGNESLAGSWQRFAESLKRARDFLSGTNWGSLDTKQARDAWLQYQLSLANCSNAFQDFKTSLWGGRLRAWLRELANPTQDAISAYANQFGTLLRDRLVWIGGATTTFLVKLIIGTAIMIIALYFFLVDGPGMIRSLQALSPLDDQYEQELLNEFETVSRAVVVAMLLSAIAQGLLAGVGYYIAGVDSVVLLTMLTTLLALVPFVGAAAIWLPVCLWLFFVDGRYLPAILLCVYGLFVVSLVDNIIKPLVLHGHSKLHPLLALLSVLGGVTALGPIGILVGPMVVVFLQTLLKILQRELASLDRTAGGAGSP